MVLWCMKVPPRFFLDVISSKISTIVILSTTNSKTINRRTVLLNTIVQGNCDNVNLKSYLVQQGSFIFAAMIYFLRSVKPAPLLSSLLKVFRVPHFIFVSVYSDILQSPKAALGVDQQEHSGELHLRVKRRPRH